MKKQRAGFFVLLTAVLLFQSCSLVPLTGRRQLSLVSDADMLSTSFVQYGQFMKENKLSPNAAQTNMVKQVGRRIQNAVTTYFAQNNLSQNLKGYKWEFNLIENKEANAWCMPGGKVAVYSGILPITQNEIGLAVVIGHEIAHAVAKHSNERMSQALVSQLGGQVLAQALKQKPQQTQQIWMSLFGVGVQLGAVLPYNRLQESEADHLGLIFMAMAGYDPNAAIGFWQRMSQNAGTNPPEFLSTHPSDENRMQKIKSEIPEAMKYYKK
ncbi:MAG: M48 family metallopeptidase [Candidatus Aminicenantes bacterium]|nr:M48 family metallopeptidase [Candidatus Aminicenantes bacterium]